MQLENQIAVRYKVQFVPNGYVVTPQGYLVHDKIMTNEAFEQLQKRAQAGQCVIVEAWTIGNPGKCISN